MNKLSAANLKSLWTGTSILRFFHSMLRKRQLNVVSPKNVVLITGCDSGLGFNIALICHSLNMTVISGCYNIDSDGAKILRSLKEPSRMITVEIDLLRQDTIATAASLLSDLVSSQGYEFTALVNNAGIMCFGEFEWQTREIFEKQIQVNLLGTMNITKVLLPLIRHQRGRIINVTSHCGLQSLAGLAPYSASKAGLRFWNDSLRVEMVKYGVHVINFIPGSLVTETNICASQMDAADKMWKALNDEQKNFYGDYFKRYNSYLESFSFYKKPIIIGQKQLLDKFKLALLESKPQHLYKVEPWRYTFYFIAFRIFPTTVVDWFTEKFLGMPPFKVKN